MKSPRKSEQMRREQELAWIGDSILSLYARSWILEHYGELCGEALRRMTCNQFLACFGNPTTIEAKIGTIYVEKGLSPAFAWIEQEIIPLFEKQEKKHR